MKHLFTFRQRPNESLTGKLARVSSDTLSQVSAKCRLTVGRLSTLFLLIALSFGFSSQAWAWGYKRANNNWGCETSGIVSKTMKSGNSVSVIILTDVGDGVNLTQNSCDGHCFYAKWTKQSGDIFRGTYRWDNGGMYCDETVVVPAGKVYLQIGSGSKVQMTKESDYTYTLIVNFASSGTSYKILGDAVSGATMENQSSMPYAGMPSSLTMSNSYSSSRAGYTKVSFDLYTNKVTETEEKYYEAGEYIYITNFKPGSWADCWVTSSSHSYAYMKDGNVGAKSYHFVLVEGTAGSTSAVYGAKITTAGTYKNIQIPRRSSETSGDPTSGAWNNTGNISLDRSKNRLTSFSDGGTTATWSTYAPPLSAITLADNGTTTYGGNGTSSNPYLVEVGTTIKVTATNATKKVDDINATINYDFKQSSTSKQNGTTATYSFTASSTASTSYTINLDGYTKVNTTFSTKKAATALYYKTVKLCNVTYDSNNATSGTVPTDETTYTNGSIVTVKGNSGNLAKTGYNFTGWNTNDTGTGTHYAAGSGTFTISDNTPLYAEWTAKTTTITFNANGGSFASTPSTKTATYGQAMPALDNGYLPTDATQDFDGFWDDATNGKQYYDDQLESVVSTWDKEDDAKILYAHWKTKQEFSVTVKNKWGDTETTIGDPITVGPVNPVDVEGTKPYTGFVFDHWDASPANTVTFGDDKSESTTIKTTAAATITAVYKTPTLSITPSATKAYDYAPITLTPGVQNFTDGTAHLCFNVTTKPQGAPDPTFERIEDSNNFTFTPTQSGEYTFNATLRKSGDCSSTVFATSADVTLTYKLKITVVAGAHITSVTPADPVDVDDNGSQDISATPADGYSFAGWQVSGAGASVDDDQQASTTAHVTNASATFTASATEDIHTITIVNGTTESTSAGVASTGTATAMADPTGQMFNNWTWAPDDGIQLVNCQATDRIITFHATKVTTVTANFMTLALDLEASDNITETKQATITPTLTAPAGQYTLCYKLLQNGDEVVPQPIFNINDAGVATFTAPAAGNYTIQATVHQGSSCETPAILTQNLAITINENLETNWELNIWVGPNQGDWHAYPFSKKAGESSGSVAYYTLQLNSGEHDMELRKDSKTYYKNSGTMTSTDCTDWTFTTGASRGKINCSVTGNYTFKVDFSGSDPKLSVTYPEENYHMVTVDNGVTSTQVKVNEATETPLEAQQYLNGMRFDRWMVTNASGEEKSSSIIINHTTSNSTHMHGATEDGLIVRATYTSEHIIYFKNFIPNWNDVYVYFYSNPYFHGDDGTGDANKGTGTGKSNANIVNGTVYHMTHIDKTDIWYFDYSSFASAALNKHTVAFTSSNQSNHNFFDQCQAVYRGDFGDCANMMVPINYIDHYYNQHDGNQTCYYEQGHWMKYNAAKDDEIGIKLHIYEWVNNEWKDLSGSPFEFVADNDGSYSSHSNINLPQGDYVYQIKLAGCAPSGTWYGNRGKMEPASCTNWVMSPGAENMKFQSTSAGPYTFRLSTGNGELKLSAEYPLTDGDFRVIHTEGGNTHWNGFIYKYVTAKTDTASFYYNRSESTPVFKVQRCTDAVQGTWVDVATFSNPSETGIYNFIFSHNGENATVVKVEPYVGDFYIRTDGVDGGKENYMANADNKMTNYGSMLNAGATYNNFQYNFYKTKWIFAGTDATFCIANDYSKQISDDFTTDNIISGTELPQNTNVRFMWNSETNQLSRAYMSGSTDSKDRFLVLTGDTKIYDTDGKNFPEGGTGRTGLLANETILDDLGNWVYQIDIQANPTARGRLTAAYNNKVQYFIGKEGDFSTTTTEQIIGGSGETKYTIRVVYDFKTNLLVSGWLAGTEPAPSVLDANMIIVRHEQDAPTAITFGTEKSMSDVKKVYMAIQLKKNEMTDAAMQGSWAEYSWKHCHYYVSFPFDVKVSEIFGLDKSYYQIQRYNGTKRAQIGWFAETSTFWEKVGAEETLYAHEGYAVQLNRTKLRNSGDDAWRHVKEANGSIYLYFPSAENFGTVNDDVVKTTNVADHECKIDRYFQADQEEYPNDQTKWRNHKATDSHWNMIGSPLFSKQDVQNVFVEDVVIQQEPSALKFYYKWISSNNSLQITAAGSEKFYSMFGYMVQYTGELTWRGVAKPNSTPARKAGADENFNIELQLTKDGHMLDRTYIQMQDGANDGFVLNEDVYKMTNAGTSNIYSYAGGYDVAANVRPIDNALIELGVKANETGTYTFSMPSNFSGTVTLMDAATQENTILNVADYTITLPQGTYEGRFFLNVEVERKIGTDYDGVDYQGNQVYKFIRDDHMYIMRDGKIYDGVGASVK